MSDSTSVRRIVVLVVLAVLVGVAAFFDDPSQTRRPVTLPEQSDTLQVGAEALSVPSVAALAHAVPTASDPASASTTWFCAGGAAEEGGPRDTTLMLTNRSGRTSRARVEVTTVDGASATHAVSVPDGSTVAVPLRDLTEAKWVGALVEATGGGVTVTQRIGAQAPVTTAACATSSSTAWYFAGGDTDRGSGEFLVLFNPFEDLVTADVAFLTDDGFRQPQRFRGIPVSPGALVVLDVADVEDRKVDMAAIVSTRAGRLMAWRTQTFDGSGPTLEAGFSAAGVSVSLGSSTASTRFVLPTTVTGEGVSTRVVVANPGAVDATVTVTLTPDDQATNGSPPEIRLEVPAGSVRVLGAKDLVAVPAGVPFTVSGAVTKGGPVVAELWLDGAEPARGRGAFATAATPVAAQTWVVNRGLAKVDLDQLGVFGATGAAELRFEVVDDGAVVPVEGEALPASVGKGQRVSVDLMGVLAEHPGASVVVHASRPVVVSRLQAGAETRGLVSFPGLPVAPVEIGATP